MFSVQSQTSTELLRIAAALIEQGELNRARILLQSIADIYPEDNDAVKEAELRLRDLRQ